MTAFDYFDPHRVTACPDPFDFCAHHWRCGQLVYEFAAEGLPLCETHANKENVHA